MNIVTRTLCKETISSDIVQRALSYVEIKTKITSVFTFLMVLAYLHSAGYGIDPLKTTVFFLGMFFFDLTTTAINNYYDTKKNHQMLQFARPTAMAILFLLFVVSVSFGILLVYLSDVVVLFLGMMCFFFGIIYSYGPIPISHGPYGEIVSGFFYGVIFRKLVLYLPCKNGKILLAFRVTYNSSNGIEKR
jgi:1,4-dihydroxy-2-naphthoate octaprenyltransferase